MSFLPIRLAALAALAAVGGCYTGVDPCVPEDDARFCLSRKKNCGDVTAKDNCGVERTVTCGQCYGPTICGGGGVSNVCDHCTATKQNKPNCSNGWCTIAPGCFTMGDDKQDCKNMASEGFGDETPHEVALSHRFEIGQSEVTQDAFGKEMSYGPSDNKNQPPGETSDLPFHPVEYVSWYEAVAFANRLSQKAGLDACYTCTGNATFVKCDTATKYAKDIYRCPGYRLPTEAEWEFVFRAGYQHDFPPSHDLTTDQQCEDNFPHLDSIGWYAKNAGSSHPQKLPIHHKVMTLAANPWGVYDMAGNVWEWTHDWYQKSIPKAKATNPAGPSSGTLKVLRGGSYEWMAPKFFRASARRSDTPDHLCYSVGFRLARTLNPTE